MYGGSTVGVVVSLASGAGYNGYAEGDTLVLIEHLAGSAHDDYLVGNGDNNTLLGDGGHDTLKGGGGADILSGDAGIDTASYEESSQRVVVALLYGTADYGDAEGDTLYSIENLTGSAHNDSLLGDNNDNVLRGMNGDDTLKGAGGMDTLRGGTGHDELFGHDDADTLRGEAGNDVLNGGAGIDTMAGGLDNDIYFVDHVNDVVTENSGQGIDEVRTSVSYALTAGADVETLRTTNDNGTGFIMLTGNSSGNEIIGNDGSNVINGGGGVDQMGGRGGNDIYYVDNPSDSVSENGGQGNDTARTSVSWALTQGADVENVHTTSDGGTASINLTGNETGNVVRGNAGSNVINGGGGNDYLTGLGGQDAFLFNTALNAATNVDAITDFNVADDTIRLENSIFGAFAAGGLAEERFVIGTALQANDNIIYNPGSGALYYDSDGNGAAAAIQFASVTPGLALTHLDFLVV